MTELHTKTERYELNFLHAHIMEVWMCIVHLALYILLWLWEKDLLDFKHSASKHEIFSTFQTSF